MTPPDEPGRRTPRPPIALVLLTAAGVALGALMTYLGLYARLFGRFPGLMGLEGGAEAWVQEFGLPLTSVAWLVVVAGTTWFGAMCAVWLGIRWGWRAAVGLALASLLYLGPGTALGILALACAWSPGVRRWCEEARTRV